MIPEKWYTLYIDWYTLKNNIKDYLYNVIRYRHIIEEYDKVTCEIKAGRQHNYDFEINYYNGDKMLTSEKIEFKFGIDKITAGPQFLSLSSKFNTKYAEYFYDNYVGKISELYNIDKIDRETYLKYVHGNEYHKNRWFQYIYDNEEKYIKEKKILTDESIHNYVLQIYKNNELDIDELRNKFVATQNEKIYMCCKNYTFYFDTIDRDELYITYLKMKTLKNNKEYYNTIICKTDTDTEYHMLLRWRNHAGILLPAWQIKIVRLNTSLSIDNDNNNSSQETQNTTPYQATPIPTTPALYEDK